MPDLISAPSLALQPAGTLNLHLLLVILKIWGLDETREECVRVPVCVRPTREARSLVPKSAPAFVTANKLSGKKNPQQPLLFLYPGIQISEIIERIDATFRRAEGAHSDHTATPA